LGERHEITAAGFAFRVPIGYASQIEEQQAFISNLEGTFVILFAGVESSSSEEDLIDEYLDALATRSQGEFEKTPSDPVTVDGRQGRAFDLTGSLFGSPLKGKTLIVPLRSNRFFFALAIFNLSEAEQAWEEQGSKVFEAVLESIEFIKPSGQRNIPFHPGIITASSSIAKGVDYARRHASSTARERRGSRGCRKVGNARNRVFELCDSRRLIAYK
jgi:hypothetical protein